MTKSILEQIEDIGMAARDNNMDGFFNFNNKKKLYRILWETQRQLDLCHDKFVGEEEWLTETRPWIEP